MSRLEETVKFDIIRYANCWEDADLLLEALPDQSGRSVFCIASAGDNALALLSGDPARIVVADLSLPQLYLTELKQMAFAYLEHAELLALLGITKAADSLALYKHLAPRLSAAARRYWDEHLPLIGKGLIYGGKFERYFHIFRTYLLPLVHRQSTIRQLFAPKSAEAQSHFFDRQWNSLSWNMLMNLFFSKYVMGRLGRDKAFLRHVEVPVSTYIRQKTEQHLRSVHCQQNYMLHMILTGSFGNTLPYYLRPQHFDSIRRNIGRLSLVQDDAEQLISETTFDTYCLSNIFEYLSAAEFSGIVQRWAEYIPQGATLAYWNLMAWRSFAEEHPGCFREHNRAGSTEDKGFFYSRFLAEQKI